MLTHLTTTNTKINNKETIWTNHIILAAKIKDNNYLDLNKILTNFQITDRDQIHKDKSNQYSLGLLILILDQHLQVSIPKILFNNQILNSLNFNKIIFSKNSFSTRIIFKILKIKISNLNFPSKNFINKVNKTNDNNFNRIKYYNSKMIKDNQWLSSNNFKHLLINSRRLRIIASNKWDRKKQQLLKKKVLQFLNLCNRISFILYLHRLRDIF